MGKGSGKRAVRKRVADVSATVRDDEERLRRATARRIAKLEKELAGARKLEERQRSRLAAATAEAERIRGEIAGLLRQASEPAVGGARKAGRVAEGLLEGAADAMADAGGGVAHAAGGVAHAAGSVVHAAAPAGETHLGVAQDAVGAVRDAAGSAVGAARHATKRKPSATTPPVDTTPAPRPRRRRKPAQPRTGSDDD